MNNSFLEKHRIALLCTAGVAVIGGCFIIYQSLIQNRIKIELKQSLSINNNTSDAFKISKEGMIEILSIFGYDLHHIENAMNNINDKTDIFEIKQYLDTNVDIWAEAKAKYEKEKEENSMGSYEEINDIKQEKSNYNSTDKSMMKFPVQVFIRLRPLIKEEIESKHDEIVYNTKYNKKTQLTTININDITARNVRRSRIKKSDDNNNGSISIKKFKGFGGILSATDNNYETFKQCILPSVDNIFKGYTVCSFAYGHTGSGKTHTILGYDENISPGMYRLTAKYINDKLQELNKTIYNDQDKVLISCRFAELYQGKMRDLFGNLVECYVREDDKGNINIRGPTLKDEESGEVKVQPLTPIFIRNGETNKLIDRVNESLKFRKQGSSAVHDESSRSHVFLEMELVTNKLMQKRTDLWNAEGELVPVGKERDDFSMEASIGRYIKDPETNQYVENKDYVEPEGLKERREEIDKKFLISSVRVKKCEEMIEEYMKCNDNKCIGGSMVFVDLAGNEWGSDSKNIENDNNVQLRERKEINKSLLSLKECVRALHLQKGHVPYRDSKLTMVLRPHLKAINSTAIMIANISPSQQHIRRAYNTLKYAHLVAKA